MTDGFLEWLPHRQLEASLSKLPPTTAVTACKSFDGEARDRAWPWQRPPRPTQAQLRRQQEGQLPTLEGCEAGPSTPLPPPPPLLPPTKRQTTSATIPVRPNWPWTSEEEVRRLWAFRHLEPPPLRMRSGKGALVLWARLSCQLAAPDPSRTQSPQARM